MRKRASDHSPSGRLLADLKAGIDHPAAITHTAQTHPRLFFGIGRKPYSVILYRQDPAAMDSGQSNYHVLGFPMNNGVIDRFLDDPVKMGGQKRRVRVLIPAELIKGECA